jgi:hypothetical protein
LYPWAEKEVHRPRQETEELLLVFDDWIVPTSPLDPIEEKLVSRFLLGSRGEDAVNGTCGGCCWSWSENNDDEFKEEEEGDEGGRTTAGWLDDTPWKLSLGLAVRLV